VPKVCHLITRLILGGAQRIALETAAFLQEQGWEVELWAGPQTGPEGSLHDEGRRRGLRIRTVPHLLREVSPIHDLRAFLSLRSRFRKSHFDLLHTHSSKAGILGRMAASAAGVPIRVHSIHGWGITPATGTLERVLFRRLERTAARRAHALLAVSEAVRDAGLADGIGSPAQYAVIHGGIRFPPPSDAESRRRARESLGIPQAALVIGTVGRLDDAKDPLGALRAALPLLESLPQLRLVFIGDGKLRNRIEAAAERSGLQDRITFAGMRSDARILACAFDIFFLSSRWEGFPLVVIEAMASGLPVVAYDVAGVREAVVEGTTGLLAPAGNEHLWREHLARLATSADLRERMGSAGRALALRRFGLDRMLGETLQLYERLFRNGRRSPANGE
jgi:glycosyltransferase involved in cell wall biosynthesis